MDPTTSGASRPQQRTPGSGGGREDAWSEGATETLIQAWGDRYISLNRGNLRQKDWREVADAVNARENGVKGRKTDVQCKNRIDTLKKKYKIEKAKPPPSKWSFFYRLDSLIGTSSVTPKKKLAGAATVKSRMNPKPELYSGVSESTESSSDDALIDNEEEEEEEEEEVDGEDLDDDDDEIGIGERVVKKKQHRMEDVNFSDGAACRELARAILKFGEIYERIESSKQQQMMELEKQRMQFTKELEFQKMNMFVDAQLELEKQALKRAKHSSASEKKS